MSSLPRDTARHAHILVLADLGKVSVLDGLLQARDGGLVVLGWLLLLLLWLLLWLWWLWWLRWFSCQRFGRGRGSSGGRLGWR